MAQGGTVHSVSGLAPDGIYRCRCDKPAVTFVSKTASNPGREFYKCADGACGLFKWKDELSPPSRPSQSANNTPFSTPSTQRTQGIATPQTTPAKRTYGMASGSAPRPTQKRELSPGAKERRLKAILQAQAEEEMRQTQQAQAQAQGSVQALATHSSPLEKHASIQTDFPDSEDEGDEEEARGTAEGSGPAMKRSKIKTELEDEEASLARSRSNSRGRKARSGSRTSASRGAGMLLTPPQSSIKEVEDEVFRSERPESPTNFTKKGGQVARSFYKGKGKEREHDAGEATASGSSFNERLAAAVPSFAELTSSSDGSQKTMPAAPPTEMRDSVFDIAMTALDNMANQHSHLRSVIKSMEEEKTRLQIRASANENRERDLQKLIEELKAANEALQEENTALTERLELIQRAFTHSPSPAFSKK